MAATGKITSLLILLLSARWFSFAQAMPGGISDSNHKMLDGKQARTSTTSKNWLRGRKMVALDRQVKKLKAVKMSGTTVEETSTFSSTNPASHFSDEVDESGFVAFNADYHPPRHHPPKNN